MKEKREASEARRIFERLQERARALISCYLSIIIALERSWRPAFLTLRTSAASFNQFNDQFAQDT